MWLICNHSLDISLTPEHFSCFLFSAKSQLYKIYIAYFITVSVQLNFVGEKYPSTMREFHFKFIIIPFLLIWVLPFHFLNSLSKGQWSLKHRKQMWWDLWFSHLTTFREVMGCVSGKKNLHKAWKMPWVKKLEMKVWGDYGVWKTEYWREDNCAEREP